MELKASKAPGPSLLLLQKPQLGGRKDLSDRQNMSGGRSGKNQVQDLRQTELMDKQTVGKTGGPVPFT